MTPPGPDTVDSRSGGDSLGHVGGCRGANAAHADGGVIDHRATPPRSGLSVDPSARMLAPRPSGSDGRKRDGTCGVAGRAAAVPTMPSGLVCV